MHRSDYFTKCGICFSYANTTIITSTHPKGTVRNSLSACGPGLPVAFKIHKVLKFSFKARKVFPPAGRYAREAVTHGVGGSQFFRRRSVTPMKS